MKEYTDSTIECNPQTQPADDLQSDVALDYEQERINPIYDDEPDESEFWLFKFGLLTY